MNLLELRCQNEQLEKQCKKYRAREELVSKQASKNSNSLKNLIECIAEKHKELLMQIKKLEKRYRNKYNFYSKLSLEKKLNKERVLGRQRSQENSKD